MRQATKDPYYEVHHGCILLDGLFGEPEFWEIALAGRDYDISPT